LAPLAQFLSAGRPPHAPAAAQGALVPILPLDF
jgi:hypothetical protein